MPTRSSDYTVDETPNSALAICSHCQARFLAASRPYAMRALLAHMQRGHSGEGIAGRVLRAQAPAMRARL